VVTPTATGLRPGALPACRAGRASGSGIRTHARTPGPRHSSGRPGSDHHPEPGDRRL